MAHDGTGEGWDTADPANTEDVADGAQEIRDLRIGVGNRIAMEHVTPAGTKAGGEHLAGSAKIFVGDYSGDPDTNLTERPDGTNDPWGVGATPLGADDAGRMCLDTSDDQIYIWDGSAWVLISTDIISVLLSATRAFAAPLTFPNGLIPNNTPLTSRNAANDGSVVLIYADTNDIVKVPVDIRILADVNPTQELQLVTKKYVDANVGKQNYLPKNYIGGETTKLPNGLIIKFGTFTSTSDDDEDFTFDEAFPTACMSVVTTPKIADSTHNISPETITKEKFTVNRDVGLDENVDFCFIAMGY